jgi:hypothetical protein
MSNRFVELKEVVLIPAPTHAFINTKNNKENLNYSTQDDNYDVEFVHENGDLKFVGNKTKEYCGSGGNDDEDMNNDSDELTDVQLESEKSENTHTTPVKLNRYFQMNLISYTCLMCIIFMFPHCGSATSTNRYVPTDANVLMLEHFKYYGPVECNPISTFGFGRYLQTCFPDGTGKYFMYSNCSQEMLTETRNYYMDSNCMTPLNISISEIFNTKCIKRQDVINPQVGEIMTCVSHKTYYDRVDSNKNIAFKLFLYAVQDTSCVYPLMEWYFYKDPLCGIKGANYRTYCNGLPYDKNRTMTMRQYLLYTVCEPQYDHMSILNEFGAHGSCSRLNSKYSGLSPFNHKVVSCADEIEPVQSNVNVSLSTSNTVGIMILIVNIMFILI